MADDTDEVPSAAIKHLLWRMDESSAWSADPALAEEAFCGLFVQRNVTGGEGRKLPMKPLSQRLWKTVMMHRAASNRILSLSQRKPRQLE